MTKRVIEELEYMAQELNYYKDKKIFKPEEIQVIIKKRRDFEEILTKKPHLPIFLLYIEHEVLLERIYERRVEEEERKKYIRRRIENIYRRAQYNLPGEKDLYISQLEYFLSVRDKDRIRQTALEIPKKLPGEPEVWIKSANALREIGEVEGSRILLQRSIRIAQDKKRVVEGFIRMEEENEEEDSDRIIEVLNREIESTAE